MTEAGEAPSLTRTEQVIEASSPSKTTWSSLGWSLRARGESTASSSFFDEGEDGARAESSPHVIDWRSTFSRGTSDRDMGRAHLKKVHV